MTTPTSGQFLVVTENTKLKNSGPKFEGPDYTVLKIKDHVRSDFTIRFRTSSAAATAEGPRDALSVEILSTAAQLYEK